MSIVYPIGKRPKRRNVYRPGRPITPVVERFWPKVNKGGEDDCWEWTGGKTSQGYGSFGWCKGVCENAQRSSWKIHYGGIPTGKFVLHKCDNKGCVNPKHLYIGTASDNIADRVRRNPETFARIKGNRRFKSAEIQRIRELYSTGKFTQRHLSFIFGCCHATIGSFIRGKVRAYIYKVEGLNNPTNDTILKLPKNSTRQIRRIDHDRTRRLYHPEVNILHVW